MTVELRSIDIKNFISYMNKPDYDSYKDIKKDGILLIQSILLSGTLNSSELRLALFDREHLSLHLYTYLTEALKEGTYFKTSTFNNIIYILWVLVDFVFSNKNLDEVLHGRQLLSSTNNDETLSLLIGEDTLKMIIETFIKFHYLEITDKDQIDSMDDAKLTLQLMFSQLFVVKIFIYF